MEENKKRPLIDSLIDTKELLILKSAVPYMDESQQKKFALAIRFIEFAKTIALFEENELYAQEIQACSSESAQERICHMLRSIKEYCSEVEKEQLETILNVLEV